MPDAEASRAVTDPQMQRIRELFGAAGPAERRLLLELAEARVTELLDRLPADSTWKGLRLIEGASSTETLADGLLARVARLAAEPQGEVETA